MSIAEQIRGRIERDGPLPFEVFQDIALYSEDGFFSTGPVRSSATGDFLTSPEVSPWFGRTIGKYLSSRTIETVIEVGAGTGSLLRPLLAELGEVETWAVEASPMARKRLEQVLPADRIVRSLDDLPERFSGAFIANELIDNLPVALAVRTTEGWVEHYVDHLGDGFEFVAVPARPEVSEWADTYAGTVPVDGVVEVQLAAADWIRRAIERLESGVIILIDYGGTAEELEPRRNLGTLRTYRGHHLGPDPLLEPGETDITVDVNFTALLGIAADQGLAAELHRQDDFLAESGLRAVVSELKHQELEHARAGETMKQLETKSERIDAETLLHPRGLGDFRVLVIEVDSGSTPGT